MGLFGRCHFTVTSLLFNLEEVQRKTKGHNFINLTWPDLAYLNHFLFLLSAARKDAVSVALRG